MELFPAQPDLSLQISPPNAKPTSGWRRTTATTATSNSTTTAREEEEEVVGLGFWKRALDSRNSINSSIASKLDKSNHGMNNNVVVNNSGCFELSLSNSNSNTNGVLHSHNHNHNHYRNDNHGNNLFHGHHHHHQQIGRGANVNNNSSMFHTSTSTTFPLQNQLYSQNHLLHHHHHHQNAAFQHQQELSQELGFLRPIRGIPVYQNPPSASFPFSTAQALDPSAAAAANSLSSAIANAGAGGCTTASSSPFQSHHHHQGLMRSRFLSRFPTKRSMRAPRMRWTTTLHARFVHAVELLGGHESKLKLKLNSIIIFSSIANFFL